MVKSKTVARTTMVKVGMFDGYAPLLCKIYLLQGFEAAENW